MQPPKRRKSRLFFDAIESGKTQTIDAFEAENAFKMLDRVSQVDINTDLDSYKKDVIERYNKN